MTIEEQHTPRQLGFYTRYFQRIMTPVRAWWAEIDAKHGRLINVVIGVAFLLFLGLAIMMLKGLVQFI
jgi:hypothetical protein